MYIYMYVYIYIYIYICIYIGYIIGWVYQNLRPLVPSAPKGNSKFEILL